MRCDHAILQATLDLLAEGGAANLSIDGVAARAGVGKATIYRRWTSKEALLLEALGTDTTVIEAPDTGNLRSDLEGYFGGLVDGMRDRANSDVLPHLIEVAFYDPEVKHALDQYLVTKQESLRQLLARAQSRGEIAPTIDLKVFVEVTIGAVVYRRLLTGEPLDRVFVGKLLDIVVG
ncbi:MAG: putative TetR family transcriptional regulator [Ilumatobacteraceae bacterium]|nr:putative TetR family transcriptional regulator [Ilumatobacteraceae bacterium]